MGWKSILQKVLSKTAAQVAMTTIAGERPTVDSVATSAVTSVIEAFENEKKNVSNVLTSHELNQQKVLVVAAAVDDHQAEIKALQHEVAELKIKLHKQGSAKP
jgi:ubiquinone biosynthesis protein UbiJ